MEIAEFLGCQFFQTPEPIDKRFGMGDYVDDISPHVKIQNDRSIGGMAAYA